MGISTEKELKDAVKKINDLLQSVQDYCKRRDVSAGKISFPRGFLRSCEQIRNDYAFIDERHVRDNIAYTTILADSILWLLMRTDIAATVCVRGTTGCVI